MVINGREEINLHLTLEDIRQDFPILKERVQLSSCSQSALHKNVKKAINKYVESWETDGMNWELWMEASERARVKFAKLINAEPEEISIVSSVSHAISSILTSLPVNGNRNELLLAETEFPCIGHAALSQEGKTVQYSGIKLEEYQQKISNKTLLTSVPHVSFYNGEISELKTITNLAHANGSYMFVDAYQGVGQVAIDVKDLDVDCLAAGAQKYLLGTPGIAFLYIKKEIAEQLIPKITGWFGQKDPFLFDIKKVEYAKGAVRFDTGTFPMINGFVADQALSILLEQEVSKIQVYLKELSAFTIDYALSKNLKVISPLDPEKKGSNTAIQVGSAHKLEVELAKRGIILSSRNDVIRIAPHYYNTEEDIEQAIDAMVEILN